MRTSLLQEESMDEDLKKERCSPSKRRRKIIIPAAAFGEIKGVSVGAWWRTRTECSAAGVHRPAVAGIHFGADDGCYSILLSGACEEDQGDCFTYAGGNGGVDLNGKNPKNSPQTNNQVLDAALALNIKTKNPVRVIRGYKLQSPFAPDVGYRYDGLYCVEECLSSVDLSGYKKLKFKLKRLPFQDPLPWKAFSLADEASINVQIPKVTSFTENVHVPNENVMTDCGREILPSDRCSVERKSVGVKRKRHTNKLKAVLTQQSFNARHNISIESPVKYNNVIPNGFKGFPSNNEPTLSTKNHHATLDDSFVPDCRIDIIFNGEGGFKGFPSDTEATSPPNNNNCHTLGLKGASSETEIASPTTNDHASRKKQMSILQYFPTARKPDKPAKCLNVVNPKGLRNNRFSSFWIPPPKAVAPTITRKNQPTVAFPPSDDKHYSKSSKVHLAKKSKKEDLKKLAKTEASTEPAPRLKPCYIHLVRYDGFIGWDCFHGFGDVN